MLTKLFRKREEQSRLDERIVWGIWCQRRLQAVYKMAAAELRVPISVLVGHVLMEWVAQNYDTLINDEHKRREFSDFLTTKYLSSQTDDLVQPAKFREEKSSGFSLIAWTQ